jgi:hypothetical protein
MLLIQSKVNTAGLAASTASSKSEASRRANDFRRQAGTFSSVGVMRKGRRRTTEPASRIRLPRQLMRDHVVGGSKILAASHKQY